MCYKLDGTLKDATECTCERINCSVCDGTGYLVNNDYCYNCDSYGFLLLPKDIPVSSRMHCRPIKP